MKHVYEGKFEFVFVEVEIYSQRTHRICWKVENFNENTISTKGTEKKRSCHAYSARITTTSPSDNLTPERDLPRSLLALSLSHIATRGVDLSSPSLSRAPFARGPYSALTPPSSAFPFPCQQFCQYLTCRLCNLTP